MKVYNRYASSLFEISNDHDLTSKELIFIAKIFTENTEFHNLLIAQNISLHEKINILNSIFQEKLQDSTLNFMKVLCQNSRVELFFEIKKEFSNLVLDKKNEVKVKITTAVDINDETKESLIKKAEIKTNKKVIPMFIIDPKILGGVIMSYENVRIDGSLKNKLQNLNNEIRK